MVCVRKLGCSVGMRIEDSSIGYVRKDGRNRIVAICILSAVSSWRSIQFSSYPGELCHGRFVRSIGGWTRHIV